MRRKNAFTLIELLAIIVILAIIAVITVPIILNIIEESSKGAARDSAYGFKDSVNKWYVSKLQEDSNYKLNGNYTISNGKLNNIEIPLSGTKPLNGNLHYTNNVLDGGCLTIGDYKVTFDTNGNPSSTEKGNCNGPAVATTCSSDEYLYEVYNYTIAEQEACETYFTGLWGCGTDTGCIEDVSNLCAGEQVEGRSLNDALIDGVIDYSDVEDFVSQVTIDSWCRPKSEECFEFSDNGDGTATLDKYLCGAEVIFVPDSPGSHSGHNEYNTEGKLLDVNIPSQLTGKNGKLTVTTIGVDAFYQNQLASVTIPNSVTSIQFNAFGGNKLTSIEIPNSVTTIDASAFGGNELTSVTIPNSITMINDWAFSYNKLTSIEIPNSVTTIGDDAFSGNNLTYVVIPNSVTTIGNFAFSKYTATENSAASNPNLTTIYNNTGRSFNWKNIVGGNWYMSDEAFETGTINNDAGNVTVTTGYPSN